MAIIATDKHVMKEHTIGPIARVLLVATIVVVGILSIVCLALQIFGLA